MEPQLRVSNFESFLLISSKIVTYFIFSLIFLDLQSSIKPRLPARVEKGTLKLS